MIIDLLTVLAIFLVVGVAVNVIGELVTKK